MANYSEFNNNNYLPGLYNDMASTVFNNLPSPQHRSPVLSQNSFTFTSPTQGITLATHRPSIQTTSPISNMSAPGVGTSWQHSIPVTMPWADIINFRGAGTTTVFTGVPVPTFPELQAQVNAPLKRPKRKALDLPDEAPMSKVYLCADQFAHMTITAQEQSSLSPSTVTGDNSGIQVFFGSRETQCQNDADAWQRFREIENRLEVELDEDFDGNIGQGQTLVSDGPRLKIVEGILESTKRHSPILPRKVMEDITKPCMQIVLWKSPGELIRDVNQEENQTRTSSSSSTTNTVTDSCSSTLSSPAEQYYMSSVNNGMQSIPKSYLLNSNMIPTSQPYTNILQMNNVSISSLNPFSCTDTSNNNNNFSQTHNAGYETIDEDEMQL